MKIFHLRFENRRRERLCPFLEQFSCPMKKARQDKERIVTFEAAFPEEFSYIVSPFVLPIDSGHFNLEQFIIGHIGSHFAGRTLHK